MDDRKIIYINLAEVTLKTNFVNDGKITVLGFCVFHFYLFNFRNASAVALNLTTRSGSERRWQELSNIDNLYS